MPLQNRVDPYGRLVADPARGLLTGNRGCLHDAERRIVRRWRSPLWISCLLEFKGWHREPMPPGRWTALFFLDEATALAAGHRPCGTCRRAELKAWRESLGTVGKMPLPRIDRRLHGERTGPRVQAPAADLPDGAMVALDGTPCLVGGGDLRPWSFSGYGPPQPLPTTPVTVLTPPTMLAALSTGYRPLVHPSGQ